MTLKDANARRGVLCGALLVALAGCAAGPDFRSPAPPAVDGYRKDPLPAATVETKAPTGDAQRFMSGADVPEQWWTTFSNEELNRRISQALAHSPSIASAQAALRQAQENANATRGSLFPSVDASAGVTRENANNLGISTPGSPSVFTLYNAGVKVNYTLDLFGSVRRGVEADSAAADYQRYQLEGTYQTLAANVATASFREASLRGQIRVTEEIIDEMLNMPLPRPETKGKAAKDLLKRIMDEERGPY